MTMILNTPVEFLLRILLATLIGAIIGYERHNRSKEAGVRTHSIVSMAAATMMIVSKYGFFDMPQTYDPSRIASTIVTGVSFIGAGIIFFKDDSIQGLTTSAGIWATAGIGMCCGAGLYVIGIFSAIVMVLVQMTFQHSFKFSSPRSIMKLQITANQNASVQSIVGFLNKRGYYCSDIYIEPSTDSSDLWILNMGISTFKNIEPGKMMEDILRLEEVKDVRAV